MEYVIFEGCSSASLFAVFVSLSDGVRAALGPLFPGRRPGRWGGILMFLEEYGMWPRQFLGRDAPNLFNWNLTWLHIRHMPYMLHISLRLGDPHAIFFSARPGYSPEIPCIFEFIRNLQNCI